MGKYILITAAGEGTRFGGNELKQFAPVNGKPLLLHVFTAFLNVDASFRFILVLPEAGINRWKELCARYSFNVPHQIVAGGKTRTASVKNGLKHIPENSLVAIHDGVRPFVSPTVIEKGFKLAAVSGSAVPVVELTDSVRILEGKNNKALNRELLRKVQTPQFFHSKIIKQAYRLFTGTFATDDATVYEQSGYKVTLFTGNRQNIKITFPEDIIVAEAMLK